MDLNQPVTKLNNIGEQRAMRLRLLDIYTIGDLIEHFPRDYEDRSLVKDIVDVVPDEVNTIKAVILTEVQLYRRNSMVIARVSVGDGTGKIQLIWFNQSYMKKNLAKGQEYLFTGKVGIQNNIMQMVSPDYEKFTEDLRHSGRIVPLYPLTNKLTQKLLRRFIYDALEQTADYIEELFPEDFQKEYNLCGRSFAIKNIHFPETRENFFVARNRLVFEEFIILLLALFSIKGISSGRRSNIIMENMDTHHLNFGFPLTKAQERALCEIKGDLQSGDVMYRLIQGDVGSGKTAVALGACAIAIQNGYQAAIMAPTEVLASQHYAQFSAFFEPLGIRTIFLKGGLKKRERERALLEIELGQAQMVVGTHAVIQDRVRFHNLGLVITDEQHRFGVKQRLKLSDKGDMPHVLVMSATPIPRTLAAVLYGDLDISVIDELPPGRQPIDTLAVNASYRQRFYDFICKEIDQGRQAYIICPVIEATAQEGMKSVLSYTEEVQSRYLKGRRVEFLHGKMGSGEKQAIMEAFANGTIDAIVSTTVIEVGVNVPNATIMLIENAERFGLSQLHQLRGRVGRGKHKSYCILVSDSKGQVAKERLKAMTDTADGFALSELDLKLRGPGDFFGTRQHGLPEMKIANLYKDTELLAQAQAAAKKIFRDEGYTQSKEWTGLRRRIESYLDTPAGY